MYKNLIFFILLSLITIVSCAKKNVDNSVSESRFEVLTYSSEISETLTLDIKDINLGTAKNFSYWTKSFQNPQNNLGHLETVANFKNKTKIFSSTKNSMNLIQPIFYENNLCHITNKGNLICKDIENKKTILTTNIKPEGIKKYEIIRGGIAYFDGSIIFADAYGQIKSINTNDGSIRWEKKIDYPVLSSPLIYRGNVFLISADNRIFCIDFETGDISWSFQTIEESKKNIFSASPVAKENIIIAPFSTGEIIAFNIEDGNVIWSDNTSKISIISNFDLKDISANPVISGIDIYSLSNNGRLMSNNIINGKRNWYSEINGSQTPIISGDQIYLIDKESQVICLNKNSGEIYWIKKLDKFKRGDSFKNLNLWVGPYLVNNMLNFISYFGEIVTILPTSGEIQSTKKIGISGIYLPIIVLKDQFIITNENGNIYTVK